MTVETLPALFDRLERFGQANALIEFTTNGRRDVAFDALCTRSRSIAAALLARGVQPPDRIALFATNSVEWVQCRLALIRINAVCVSIDYDADPATLARILAHSDTRLMFVSADLLDIARQACRSMERPPAVILLQTPDGAEPPVETMASLDAPEPDAWPTAKSDDVVSRSYTSGTTGTPKAVPLSHRNIATNLRILSALDLAGPDDRVLLPLPLHHSFPFIVGLLLPLLAGATVVLPAGVTGPALVQALKDANVTVLIGVPRLYRAMMDGIETRIGSAGALASRVFRLLLGLSLALRKRLGWRCGRWLLAPLHRQFAPKLRLLASGGAKLSADLTWRLEALGYMVLQGYGLVETTSVATFNRPDANRPGSAGQPPPGVDLRIVPVPDMADGEVQIRGPIVFGGYAENDEENRAAFTADGWFRTGDLGRIDAEGFLHITGRLKEIIVLPGGKNIEPEIVEQHYRAHPFIEEIAVMERNERLVALVVPNMQALREASSPDFQSNIRVALGERGRTLPGYMRIADFLIARDGLPKNHLGKYQRHRLPEIYARAERGEWSDGRSLTAEDRASMGTDRGRRLMAWLGRHFPDRPIHPDTSLQIDLGIDSLAWVDLGLDLEHRLGIALSEEQIAAVMTVRDLLGIVEAADAAEWIEPAVQSDSSARAAELLHWLDAPGPVAHAAGFAVHALARMLAKLFFRLRVAGLENVPAARPLIIAVNHQSDVDPPLVGAALPWRVMRDAWWSGDRYRLFGSRIGRLFARVVQMFPVDDRAPALSLELATETLQRGRILIWFPESWRSPTGEILQFRPGIGSLVARTGATVLPAYISGAIDAMPRDAHFPRPHPVSIRFGEPIAADMLIPAPRPDDARALHAAIAARLRDEIVALQEIEEGPAPQT